MRTDMLPRDLQPIVVKIIFNYGILRFLTGSGIATALNLTIERVAYTVG